MIHNELLIAAVCIFGIGVLYAIYNYINDRIEQSYIRMHERSSRMNNNINEQLAVMAQQIKDNNQANSNCCKTGFEKSNREMFQVNDRLRTLEQALFAKETQNENGERVISVIVPSLKQVPLASEPLGSSPKGNPEVFSDSDENFYIKSDVEKKLKEKYEDFDSIMTKENIELLKNDNPNKAIWLRKIRDLLKKGEETYLAIKKMKYGIKPNKEIKITPLKEKK